MHPIPSPGQSVTADLLASIPSPSQGVWEIGPFPLRAYALCIIAGIIVGMIIPEMNCAANAELNRPSLRCRKTSSTSARRPHVSSR